MTGEVKILKMKLMCCMKHPETKNHSLGLLRISMAENGQTVALILKPKQSSLPRLLLCKQFSLQILTLPFCDTHTSIL